MKNCLRRLIVAQDGQDLVEYGLLIAIVAMGAVAALTTFQTVIANAWTTIATMLSD